VHAPVSERAPEGGGAVTTTRTAWVVLAVLTLVNLFNYLDRFVLAGVLELIHTSELHTTDFQDSLLATAFLVVYTAASPFFGTLGDRRSRPRLLASGVAAWSLAAGLTGLAPTFGWLLFARAFVGIGEAAYATIAPALLADYFPAAIRGRILSVFYSAIPIGSALGYVAGGALGSHFGWRAAFLVSGLPGLALALAAYFMPEAPTRRPAERAGGLADYGTLLRDRPYRIVVLGYAAYNFGLGGIAFWMPTFLQRVQGMALARANYLLGVITVITGFVGTLSGGWLGDRLKRRWREGYGWLNAVSTLLAAPCAYLAFTLRSQEWIVALIVAEVLIFMSTGPVNSSIVGLVPPSMRATAMALSILAIHFLGDVPAMGVVGRLSDAITLERAVLIIPAAVLLGGLIWLYGAWRGERASPRIAAP
jgi:MFS transporter, Spinster family, sphingosine-1-phosphate transporter